VPPLTTPAVRSNNEVSTNDDRVGRAKIARSARAHDSEILTHSHTHTLAQPETATFTPAEPRLPLPTIPVPGPIQVARGFLTPPSPHVEHPDEYLFDGGDRDLPVHYDQFNRLGLDTEDTVIEYTDDAGQRHMRPTNRVAVFAPRFGAVRSVSQPEEGSTIEKLASAQDTRQGRGLGNRIAAVDHAQRDQLGGVRERSRASGLETELGQSGVNQATRASSHTKLINLYEDLTFVRSGRFVQSDEARLANAVQAAANWLSSTPPFIAAKTEALQDVYASFRPQEFIGREDRRKPGLLRIVKLADKATAQPGDVITFTIRYDNLGERELYHIRVVDNLTPRLIYVDDSAESDRNGRLVVEDNEEGSLVLRFELDEPLPGRQGGVVSFQARVK
jgi:uncharacterized repeat protein (TIGR01451 family)